MFPCFVTAFSFPDAEPTEMSPRSTSTSVKPEKSKTYNNNYLTIITMAINSNNNTYIHTYIHMRCM